MSAHDLAAHVHHESEDEHNRSGERRTRWVVGITAIMMVSELVIGWRTGSVALTADGWHMGTHVGALGLTLLAYWYARTRAGNDAFSFGTGKVYSLAGYTSGVMLAIVAVWMAVEGIEHLVTHPDVDYGDALPVAIVGLLVNGVSAFLLSKGHHYGHGHGHHHHGHGHGHDHDDHDDHDHDDDAHDHAHHEHAPHREGAPDHGDNTPSADQQAALAGTLDFNLRAAYIHIIADALTSLAAIISLSLGWWKPAFWFLDPLMGLVGGGVIVWWAVSLCRQASRQLLDVVSSPKHEQLLRQKLEAIDDVRVADLHVWELGPGRRSCIVSIVTARPCDLPVYRAAVLAVLPLAHLTIEVNHCQLAHAEARLPPVAAEPATAHAHEH